MTSPGILVFGQSLPELQAFVASLISLNVPSESSSASWQMENKYYTAQVAVNMLTTDQSLSELPLHVDHQAVVAVFNATATLDQVQHLWSLVEEHTEDYEIKLVVALCTEASARPDWLDKADSWLAEQFVEMVVVDDLNKISNGATRAAISEGGAQGMQRVVEALQAHVWPGMQRKSDAPSAEVAQRDNAAAEAITENSGADPNLEALLREVFREEMAGEEEEELDKLFTEVLDFRRNMLGASRTQRADAAADIVLRLNALMGADTDEEHSDNDDESESGSESVDEVERTDLSNGNAL